MIDLIYLPILYIFDNLILYSNLNLYFNILLNIIEVNLNKHNTDKKTEKPP